DVEIRGAAAEGAGDLALNQLEQKARVEIKNPASPAVLQIEDGTWCGGLSACGQAGRARNDAFDPELTKDQSKCRTAASSRCPSICYALTLVWGSRVADAICPIETTCVYHAARRRGGVARCGASTARRARAAYRGADGFCRKRSRG